MTRRAHTWSGSVLTVSTALLLVAWAHPAAAAEPPPPPPEGPRPGAEFLDPPEWLVEQRKREAEERRAKELAERAKSDEKEAPGYLPGYRKELGVGLSPHAPQRFSALPGAFTPSFGSPKADPKFRLSFHGYVQAALRAGIGRRDEPSAGQNSAVFHGDPMVVGSSFGWFDHTNTVQFPWAQLNFTYGSDVVSANVIFAAWSFNESDRSSTYFNPPSKVGIQDAFLTYHPRLKRVKLDFTAGAFAERYGNMAQYDAGAYSAQLIASVFGTGLTGVLTAPLPKEFGLSVEAGIKGDLDTAPVGIIGDQSNEFARPIEGSTYVGHVHVGWRFKNVFQHSVHYVGAFSADERKDDEGTLEDTDAEVAHRDGTLTILGSDVRLNVGRFGHWYLGGAYVLGRDTESISNIVQILNTGGGQDLMQRYWGAESRGNGTLTFVGTQYTLSLGTLLRHPDAFWGIGPDLIVSVFGIYGRSVSVTDELDSTNMLKYGAEATYSVTPWFALSGRFDHVMPDLSDPVGQGFVVLSPRLIFRTNWKTQETISVQYAGYLLGDDVQINGDNRFLQNPSDDPDRHLILVSGTMWW